MKKFLAIVLSMILVAAFAVTASAFEPEAKEGYTAYPLFTAEGAYTPGVKFKVGSTEMPAADIASRIGQGYPANCYPQESGVSFIIWTNAGHHGFDRAIRVCNADATVVITFNGTGIRLGTGYREWDSSTIAVTIDGQNVDADASALSISASGGDTTTPTIFFEKEGLSAGEHTLTLNVTNQELEMSWFEVKASAPVTGSYTVAAAVAAVVAVASVAVVSKKHH